MRGCDCRISKMSESTFVLKWLAHTNILPVATLRHQSASDSYMLDTTYLADRDWAQRASVIAANRICRASPTLRQHAGCALE